MAVYCGKGPLVGGYWERLVRSVKWCLRKTLGRSTLTFDELATILVEIEATLNNRLLTYVCDDTEGLSYALTPADLIYGHRLAKSLDGRQFEVTSTAKTLTKRSSTSFVLLINLSRSCGRIICLTYRRKELEVAKIRSHSKSK